MRRVGTVVLAGLLGFGACSPSPSTPPGPSAPETPALPSVAPGSPVVATPAGAVDLVLLGGNVRTIDAAGSVVTALAISGDRIQAVGSDDEVAALADGGTLTIDLRSRTVVPGFIDAHEHRIVNGPGVLGRDAADIVQDALRQGYTTLDELYLDPSWIETFTDLDAAGGLPLHVNAYLSVNENSAEGRLLGDYFGAYRPGAMLSPHVRVAGLKIFTDFDNATIMLWQQADLDAFVLARYREGWPLAIKTVGTNSFDMILDAIRKAISAGPAIDVRGTRLEHMLFATPEHIAAVKELGLLPIINLNLPGQVVGDASIEALISRNPEGSYVPWRSLFDAGIEPAGMSGFPSSYVDEPTGAPFGSPLHMIWQAVTRSGNLGARSPEELLDQAITAEQALRSLTINAATASGERATKGSLEPGKLADLVILSADPLTVETPAINEIETLVTMVAGEIAWCAPEVSTLCAGGGPVASPPGPIASPAGGVVMTASQSLPDNPPEFAADLDPDTAWVAGADAEQWIQAQLPSPLDVGRVVAVVTQEPAGETVHQLWVGSSVDDLELVDTIAEATEEGDELTFEVPESARPIRVFRIVTTASPSWVAWREILLAN